MKKSEVSAKVYVLCTYTTGRTPLHTFGQCSPLTSRYRHDDRRASPCLEHMTPELCVSSYW